MDGNSEKVGLRLGRIRMRLLGLRRVRAENRRDVEADILELDVRHREGAHIAAGAGERDPWSGMYLAPLVNHLWGGVRYRLSGEGGNGVGPVGKGRHAIGAAVRVEVAQAVADRDTELVAVDTSQRSENVDGSMRNEWRVMVGKERALVLEE